MKTGGKEILVFAHWAGFKDPVLIGMLSAETMRGKESFAFEYDPTWLEGGFSYMIDPDLLLYSGRFYPRGEKTNFGVFLDSCPDRWGRVLMQRREAIVAKSESRSVRKLMESDYLLGVYDGHRMGALRFRTDNEGPFLNNNPEMASPPWTSLRTLEEASRRYEADDINDPDYLRWINLLIAPGSSLGGARPKAGVVDEKGHLWIAKFPSKDDIKDVGAWEMVVSELAVAAGVNMSTGKLQKFNNNHHTYLTKRFDRIPKGARVHFASGMTMLGYVDGDNSSGASYLELAEFIIRHGAKVDQDLEELWRRIVFNICVKNTDDHLRNHGFLLSDKGWLLSPAFDINPNEYGKGLSLNISESDNSLSLDLALDVAEYFRVDSNKANKMIAKVRTAVIGWKIASSRLGVSRSEQERMSPAFTLE